VRALDALPLALELAASRMRWTTVSALTLHLDARLEGLRANDDRPTRHQSLRAALDGSWELLSGDDRRALAQLTVFEGGFDADAARAVAEPLDLGALVDRSWVQVGADKRFSLLRVVRAYVGERGLDLGDAEARHGRWYAALGRAALDAPSPERALASELPDLAAACRRAAARGDGPVAVDTLVAACAVLESAGPSSLVLELAQGVPGDDPRVAFVRAQAELALGRTEVARASLADARDRAAQRGEVLLVARIDSAWAGLTSGIGRLDEALEACGRALAAGDVRLERTVLLQLGNVHRFAGRYDAAREAYERSLSSADRASDARIRCYALGNLAVVLHHGLGRLDEARGRYEQALAEARRAGVARYEGNVLGNLGALCDEQLLDADADAYYRAALAVHRALGSRREVGGVLGNFANLLVRLRRFDEARAAFDEALAIHREVGNRREEGIALGNLGSMWVERGDPVRALGLFEQALAIHREVGNRVFVGHCHDAMARAHVRRGDLDAARSALEVALGVHRESGNAMNQAETLVESARLALAAGRPDEAERAAADALAIARALGDPMITAAALVRSAYNALAERPADARRALAEAEALARPHWPVWAEIGAARALLAQRPISRT
ncbi:MAG: tetratricopeptide repeat protein, partial [Myxococcota bacterium]